MRTHTPASLTLGAVLSLIGFTAIIGQIVLMRELLVVFYGNEVSLGIVLANWLIWTALGSGVLGVWAARADRPRRLVAAVQVFIAAVLPLTVLAVRASRRVLQSVPGEVIGLGPIVGITLVTLSLFCLASGFLFAAGSRLYICETHRSTAGATSSVYLLEAVGSGLGGVLASVLLIRLMTPFEIVLLLTAANLCAACVLILSTPVRRAAASLLLLLLALFFLPGSARALESLSLDLLWSGFHLVESRNSIYGNLAVVETEGSRSLFENGLVLFTVPDPEAAEEAVHFALLQHPSPRSLLLVGGGAGGSVEQALQHPSLERLDYVEPDPMILDLVAKHFPEGRRPVAGDTRLSVHHTDGRLFLKRVAQPYDVVIVNLPDPQTAQVNRFFTVEFFKEVRRKLRPGGLFSFQVTGAENYISREQAEFLQCLNRTLRSVFEEVTVIPGGTVHFFASAERGILTSEASVLVQRLRSRNLQTAYVREYYLPFRLMPDRVNDLKQQMEPKADTPVNQDFAPIAYYFDIVFWSTRFDNTFRHIFSAMARFKFSHTVSLVALVLPVALFWSLSRRRKDRPLGLSVGCCVAAMGFTLIGLEMLLLMAFQAIYGYVYFQLTLLIAAFMAGMALGSWVSLQGEDRSSVGGTRLGGLRLLAWLQIAAAVSPLVLYGLFRLVSGTSSAFGLFLVSSLLFPLLALLCGGLGGYQFPLASRIYFGAQSRQARSPGVLYGLDLLGACLGALALSAYLFPVFGFFKSGVLMALLNLAPASMAFLSVGQIHTQD